MNVICQIPLFKHMRYPIISALLLWSISCSTQHTAHSTDAPKTPAPGNISQSPYGAGDIVTKGYLDSKGVMWFTTTHEGVYKYENGVFTNITEEEGLCSNDVSAVLEDDTGKLWFGTAKGLCVYNGSDFTHIYLPQDDEPSVSPQTGFPSRKTEAVSVLIQDRNSHFWLGTDASGAYRYDQKAFTSFLKFEGRLQPDSMYNNCITSITEDQAGNIWFTSMTHGAISRFDGQSLKHFTTEDGLLGDMITSSFEDQSGRLWFGSIQNLEGGISMYDGQAFTNYTQKDGLCDSNVVCFYEDESGKIWIGTGNGVCYFDGKRFTDFRKDGESLGDIRFITQDKEGHLWFGGRYGVLYRYDGSEITDFTYEKR